MGAYPQEQKEVREQTIGDRVLQNLDAATDELGNEIERLESKLQPILAEQRPDDAPLKEMPNYPDYFQRIENITRLVSGYSDRLVELRQRVEL